MSTNARYLEPDTEGVYVPSGGIRSCAASQLPRAGSGNGKGVENTFFLRQRSAPGGFWSLDIGGRQIVQGAPRAATAGQHRNAPDSLQPASRAVPVTSWTDSRGKWRHRSSPVAYEDDVRSKRQQLPRVLVERLNNPRAPRKVASSTEPRLGVGRGMEDELDKRIRLLQEIFAPGQSRTRSPSPRIDPARLLELAKPKVMPIPFLPEMSFNNAQGDALLPPKPRRKFRIPAPTQRWVELTEEQAKVRKGDNDSHFSRKSDQNSARDAQVQQKAKAKPEGRAQGKTAKAQAAPVTEPSQQAGASEQTRASEEEVDVERPGVASDGNLPEAVQRQPESPKEETPKQQIQETATSTNSQVAVTTDVERVEADAGGTSPEEVAAAVKIQSLHRGKVARRETEKKKTHMRTNKSLDETGGVDATFDSYDNGDSFEEDEDDPVAPLAQTGNSVATPTGESQRQTSETSAAPAAPAATATPPAAAAPAGADTTADSYEDGDGFEPEEADYGDESFEKTATQDLSGIKVKAQASYDDEFEESEKDEMPTAGAGKASGSEDKDSPRRATSGRQKDLDASADEYEEDDAFEEDGNEKDDDDGEYGDEGFED